MNKPLKSSKKMAKAAISQVREREFPAKSNWRCLLTKARSCLEENPAEVIRRLGGRDRLRHWAKHALFPRHARGFRQCGGFIGE
jgi:hypothetical protein